MDSRLRKYTAELELLCLPEISLEEHLGMVKSIVKKNPPTSPAPLSSAPPTARDERNRELALHHAHLLQQRKDVEALILEATETLLDFPSSAASESSKPSPADAARVKDLLKPFQPTDYDSLLEERNIDGKCGYVLCPLPHRVENTTARFRIILDREKGANGMKVVEKNQLERWCSEDCGRRALYIRVQLSEVPAWTRAGGMGGKIELYGEDITNQSSQSTMHDVKDLTSQLKQLAIERGGRRGNRISSDLMNLSVLENDAPTEPSARPPTTVSSGHPDSSQIYHAVEGYIPMIGGSRRTRRHQDNEMQDIIETI